MGRGSAPGRQSRHLEATVPASRVLSPLTLATQARIADEVEAVLREYRGGRAFFDAMDARMRLSYAATALKLAEERYGTHPIATSGRFGNALAEQCPNLQVEHLRFIGGLRHVEVPSDMFIPSGRQYVFLDDSCYLGRTFYKVRKAIETAGSTVVGALILYDGAAEPLGGVESIYRWRDRPSLG